MTVEFIEIEAQSKAIKPPEKAKPTPPPIKEQPAPQTNVPPLPELEEPQTPDLETVKKEAEKPKPKPKPPEPKPKKPEKEKPDFNSLLKNLTPDLDTEKVKQADTGETDTPTPDAPIATKLSMSEEDALRQQLAGCWNVMAGAKYAENLVVKIRAFMNQDRTVNRAVILDQSRYNRDTHFRAAADAAIRALRNPRCTPLKLPPEKYDQWKTIVITFDPKDML
jgi:outer membrane biosynthesis protein TonB